MFLTDNQTLQDISDTLKSTGVGNLPPWWTSLNSKSHAWAYHQIVQALARRGYSKALIDTWDEGSDIESDLTIFRALSRGGALEGISPEVIKMFDRREELLSASLVVNGAVKSPDLPTVGSISAGFYDHSQDLFKGPTDPASPQSPNPDVTTQW